MKMKTNRITCVTSSWATYSSEHNSYHLPNLFVTTTLSQLLSFLRLGTMSFHFPQNIVSILVFTQSHTRTTNTHTNISIVHIFLLCAHRLALFSIQDRFSHTPTHAILSFTFTEPFIFTFNSLTTSRCTQSTIHLITVNYL